MRKFVTRKMILGALVLIHTFYLLRILFASNQKTTNELPVFPDFPKELNLRSGALDAQGKLGYVVDEKAVRRAILQRFRDLGVEHSAFGSYLPLNDEELEQICGEQKPEDVDGFKVLTTNVVVGARDNLPHVRGTAPLQANLKILCALKTSESHHHRLKVITETWGWRCDGFLAASTITPNETDLGAFALQFWGEEERDNLWQKTRSLLFYLHDHFLEDYDYFALLDDDTHVVVENLRNYLQELHTQDPNVTKKSLYLGGYMCRKRFPQICFNGGGAGYIFNRHTLERLVKESLPTCFVDVHISNEDFLVGNCLLKIGIHPFETWDSHGKPRFRGKTPTQLVRMGKQPGIKGLFYRLFKHQKFAGFSRQSITFHNFKSAFLMKRHHAVLYGNCPQGSKLLAQIAN